MNTSLKDVHNFIQFAQKHLGISSLPKINLVGSSENSKNAFGHFLGARKGTSITVRVTDRHPIDVMRTLAHELIHYSQRLSGVHKSEQMREDEANAMAGRIMRDYDTTYPKAFKDKPVYKGLREDAVAANAVGGGGVEGIGVGPKGEPGVNQKKKKTTVLKDMARRLMPGQVDEIVQLGNNAGSAMMGDHAIGPKKRTRTIQIERRKKRFSPTLRAGAAMKREQPTKGLRDVVKQEVHGDLGKA